MEHRRLTILFAIIALFAFGVIVWYFLFSTPEPAPTLEQPTNPLSISDLPARFGFIFQNEPPEQTTETEITPAGAQPFVQVWDKPSAGNVFVSRHILREATATTTVGTTTVVSTRTVRATTTVLMFVDRVTGYVYGYGIESGKPYQISNTTIPGVYDAYIWEGGNKILMRYVDSDRKTISSILATIPNVQEGRDPQPLVDITNLPNNISSVAVSGNLSSLSYVVPNDVGSSIYTLTLKGTSRVADSPLSEWTLSYGGNKLFATTKASAYTEGMTVSLPSFSRVLGEKTGLLALPSTGSAMLASMWSRSGLSTFGYNNGETVVSPVRTLASKCAHFVSSYFLCGVPKTVPRGDQGLPDDWYQGRVSFDDDLVRVDASEGGYEVEYVIDEKYRPMDITHLRTTPSGNLVSFIRKQDGSLFLFNPSLIGNE